MKKLVFVLPQYQLDAPSHYPYLVKQLQWLSKKYQLKVLIEKPLSPLPAWLKAISLAQKFTCFPLSLIERFFLLKNLKSQGFHYIYIHYSHFTVLLARLLGLTSYFWHCEKYATFPLSRSLKEYFLNTWPLLLAFKHTDYLITGDQLIKKAYHQRFQLPLKKVLVIPNWVDNQQFKTRLSKASLRKKLNLPQSKKIILFIHHLSPRKGSRQLPQIIKSALLKDNQLFFLIIGSGPDKTWLKNQLKGISQVKFVQPIPQPQLANYYLASDIFILPSQQEGFPRVILEAMAANLAIVSFNVGNLNHLLPSPMLVSSVSDMVKAILKPVKPVKYPQLKKYSFLAWQQQFIRQIPQ